MKDIRFMTYDKLYENFQIILNMEYIDYIITDKKVLDEFYRTYPRNTANETQSLFLRNFFRKNQKAIDNEAYVFFTLKALREGILGFDGSYDEVRKRCCEALKNSKYTIYELNHGAKKVGDEIRKTTAADLIGRGATVSSSKNAERIARLKEHIALESLFTVHSPTEMVRYYGTNSSLNSLVNRLGLVDTLNEVYPISMKERMNLLKTSNIDKLQALIYENTDKITPNVMMKYFGRMPELLEKYPDAFDLDKVLLICGYRVREALRVKGISDEDTKAYVKCLILMEQFIESKKTKLEGLDSSLGEDSEKHSYSYKDLVADCNRITPSGLYLTEDKEEFIISKIDEDPSFMIDVEPDYLRIIKFAMSDIERFSKERGVFEYLVVNGIIDKNQVRKVLENGIAIQDDVILLYENGLIEQDDFVRYLKSDIEYDETLFKVANRGNLLTANEKLDYYLKSKISLDLLEGMSDEHKVELTELLTPEMLIELYQDESKQDEYLRYSALYRNFVINKATQDEKVQIGEAIIEATDGEFEDKDLVQFYEQHLISLTTLESWSGSYLVSELMKDAKLRPADVKELCRVGNYDAIINIMRDLTVSKDKKLAIFYTTFSDGESDLTEDEMILKEAAREEALKALNLVESKSPSRSNCVISGRVISGESKKRNEYVSDPMSRWKLMELLDSDYSYEMLDSGMMIFKLPNVNGGTIILEKMFKKHEPDYARASKFINMTIEDFEKIKPSLITSNDIFPATVEECPALNGRFESVRHTPGWGEKIAELAGCKTDHRRSKDNIEAIEKEIIKIKKSRRLR